MHPRNIKTKLTTHAFKRMEEFQLEHRRTLGLFYSSEKSERPPNYDTYDNDGVQFWRNGTYLFVSSEQEDRMTGEPIHLIITIHDQMLNINSDY